MNNINKILIVPAQSTEQLNHIRDLLHTFLEWHLKRHSEDTDLINQYFDKALYEKELNGLPGKYIYPDGILLLAYFNNIPAGCVALQRIDLFTCEMKRMFVYENFHNMGIGKCLADSIIEEAKNLKYTTMKLDTSFRQREAQMLYQKIGFRVCDPYYSLPDRLKNWLVFMELKLI
jgi:GNAT superfamily N-acetyltransferase